MAKLEQEETTSMRRILIRCPECKKKAQIPIVNELFWQTGFYPDSMTCMCGGKAILRLTEPMSPAENETHAVDPDEPCYDVGKTRSHVVISKQHVAILLRMVEHYKGKAMQAEIPPGAQCPEGMSLIELEDLSEALQ